jgi:hypothetical protein
MNKIFNDAPEKKIARDKASPRRGSPLFSLGGQELESPQ